MSHLFKFTVSHQISEKLLLEATGLIEFKKDQMVKSIFGPSGCGKTSLVKIFLGLIKDSNSRIQFQDQIWQNAKNRILVPTDKRNTGFVPQKECLFPFLNVRDNISYAIKSQGVSIVQTRVHELAQLFQIEDLLDRKISEISGGQKQKVSLARAIAAKPQFLLLDEAFSSLDSKSREELLPKLCLWLNQFEIPTLVVSHDEKDARLLSSEIYQFEDHKLHI